MTSSEQSLFQRSCLLLGQEIMQRLYSRRVILFGVGGVGSWCAESLLRSGVHCITLVDSDCVCASNCNRQLMATSLTIGKPKVEALRDRLLQINPDAEITVLQKAYSRETADDFSLESYDYVIDAIDSLAEKALLIRQVTALTHAQGHPCLFSSMGAALRVDPTQVTVGEFWKVQGDPLARALRVKFRKEKRFPAHKFLCVYSAEPPRKNLGTLHDEVAPASSPRIISSSEQIANQDGAEKKPYDWHDNKVQVNGSLCPITGIFGMTLAGLVLRDVCSTASSASEQ